MVKAIKIAVGFIVVVGLLLFALIRILSEPLPVGRQGAVADQMALNMMESLNMADWVSTDSVAWTFKNIHHHEWNIEAHQVKVKWDDIEVSLDHSDGSGVVTAGADRSGLEVSELLETAEFYFNNDSFWLCAPFKAFDPGTERSVVQLEDGRIGLKVSYTSGGSTPGDSYVWILGPDNRPVAVKMWVSIIPIGGMEFTWENYTQISSGAWIAQDHIAFGKLNIDLTNVR